MQADAKDFASRLIQNLESFFFRTEPHPSQACRQDNNHNPDCEYLVTRFLAARQGSQKACLNLLVR